MKEYSHLGPTQRYQIEALLKANKTQSEIADILGCHPSTISREIRRNSSRVYRAEVAQKKTERRHRLKPKIIRFTEEMRTQVVDWLSVEKLSPELISVMGRQLNRDFVSDETIYKWIWASKYDVSRSNKPYRKLYKMDAVDATGEASVTPEVSYRTEYPLNSGLRSWNKGSAWEILRETWC